MTERELREKIAGLVENESAEARQESKGRRRMRRIQSVQKSDRLLHIINYGGYAPHRGYIDWGFDGRTLLHTGKYIKYPQIATVKDGSSEKPVGKSAAVGMFQRREITTATYLATGGRFIGKKLQIKIILQNNSVNQETKNVGK